VSWDQRAALGVVMAAKGYPAGSEKGEVIEGLEGLDDEGLKVFHAGTAERDNLIVINGGRVLCVTALAASVTEAQRHAYSAVEKIQCPGLFFRKDIGSRAVAREAVDERAG